MSYAKKKTLIGHLRRQKNLTQKEFSKLIGMSASCFARIEQGKGKGRPRTMRKIADYLGISVKRLWEQSNES